MAEIGNSVFTWFGSIEPFCIYFTTLLQEDNSTLELNAFNKTNRIWLYMQYYFRERTAFSSVSTVLFLSFQKAAQRHGPKRNVSLSSVWKAIVGSAHSADLDPSISSGMNPNAVCMTMKRSWTWSLQLRGLKAVQQHISTAGFRITRPAPHADVMSAVRPCAEALLLRCNLRQYMDLQWDRFGNEPLVFVSLF